MFELFLYPNLEMASVSRVATPLVVEITERVRPVFKRHPLKIC